MAGFRFKKFKIEQERTAMKVNTDGVLLAAWMNILPSDSSFLDIGTGTGVLALICAQRLDEMHNCAAADSGCMRSFGITGLEIDGNAYADAVENVSASPWPWVNVLHIALQDYTPPHNNRFDLIFTNPPYFIHSLKSMGSELSKAKHTDTLSQMDLLNNTLRLLKAGGRLAMILPVTEGREFIRKTEFVGKHGAETLNLIRICEVYSVEHKPAKRLLMEFVKGRYGANAEIEKEKLVICGADNEPFRRLMFNYYL